MNAILDAGAFVAIERRDRKVGAMLRVLQQQRVPLRTSAAVLAQVWRDGRKQAELARVLTGVDVRALSPGDDKRTGELLGRAKMNDVVDGHVAVLTDDGDRILTSDADDLDTLVRARGIKATIVAV